MRAHSVRELVMKTTVKQDSVEMIAIGLAISMGPVVAAVVCNIFFRCSM